MTLPLRRAKRPRRVADPAIRDRPGALFGASRVLGHRVGAVASF